MGLHRRRFLQLGAGLAAMAAVPRLFAGTQLRVGHFPNITHPQALVGRAKGWFEPALGSQVDVKWNSFNAGPSEMEALLSGALDLIYIGPNPALTGFMRSQGRAVRVIAGSNSGGASLVVRGDSGIRKAADFSGKRVATPQLGNTQDIALRHWLRVNNLKTTDKGGTVQVIPVENPDQLTLFLRKQIDAAWSPEPWATRLMVEAGGRQFLDERSLWPNGAFTSAELVASTKILQQRPDLVKNWVRAHVELTDWINANKSDSIALANQELQKETGKALAPAIIQQAFGRMTATYDPLRSSLLTSAQNEFQEGFLGKQMPDLTSLFDLQALNSVMAEKKRKAIT